MRFNSGRLAACDGGSSEGERKVGGSASVDEESGGGGTLPAPSGGGSSNLRYYSERCGALSTAALLVFGWVVGYGCSVLLATWEAEHAGTAALVTPQGVSGPDSGASHSVLGSAITPEAEVATLAWARPAPSEGGELWVHLPPLAQWNGAAWPYTWPGTALEGVADEGAYSQAAGLLPCPPHKANQLVHLAMDAAVNSPQDVDNAVPAVDAMPEALAARYTLGAHMASAQEYYNDVAWGMALATPLEYSVDEFATMREDAKAKRTSDYTSTDEALHALLERHPTLLEGARVVVMGSVVPWYEAMAFAHGAAEVLTVEYGPRKCDYPGLYFATPAGVANCSLAFDVGFSISSFEHDGLGRYGDKLLPEADLLAMRAMKHFVRPGGYLLFAVPIGLDTIVFNAHRVYGHARWQLVTAGWEIVDFAGTSDTMWALPSSNHMQPAWLLRNTPYPLPS